MMSDLGVLLESGADRVELVDHLLVDGVADLGAVEQHHHAVLALFDQERAEACPRRAPVPGPPLDALQQHGRALADADAHGGEADLGVFAFHPAEQGDGDPGAGGPERVAQGDRAAVAVHDLRVEAEPAHAGQGLGRERLVELDGAEVIDAEPGTGEHLLGGRDRADAHDLGLAAGGGAVDDAGPRA